jgi:hypothetical protein
MRSRGIGILIEKSMPSSRPRIPFGHWSYLIPMFNGLSIDQVIERQNELFKRIPVEIDPDSRENDCYPNCVKKVERDGGLVVVGWRRTRATTDANLIATLDHHAVWQNPAGALIDISRRIHFLNDRVEIITDEHSYFMPDPTANFGEDNRARPSWHIPLVPDTHGCLRKACQRMDYRARLLEVGEEAKASYEYSKIVELLRKHLGRK